MSPTPDAFAGAQLMRVLTPVLDIACWVSGPEQGSPVVLLHGFPYDALSYERVASDLAQGGYRVYVPYLRGFGPTRFRYPNTMRSGQQAALAQDLLDLMDGLGVRQALLAGFDWGGRAACAVAATHPQRVSALVSVDGYNIQDIATGDEPAPPERERAKWYQHYLQTETGRAGLDRYREQLCRLLWQEWSPLWRHADPAFARTAPSLHNPDFVDVVVHSYRHRRGAAAGDPRHQGLEDQLTLQPPITVPTLVLAPTDDGFLHKPPTADRDQFTGPFQGQWVPGAGHNPPQEAPHLFLEAVINARTLAGDAAGEHPR